MGSQGRIHVGILHNAGINHRLGAGENLLRGLEHQLDGALQLLLMLLEDFCRTQQHSGVGIMAAGVGIAVAGAEFQVGVLLHGEGIHIAPQQKHLSRVAHCGDDAALADFLGLIAHFGQFFHDEFCGVGQFIPDFRVLVQVTPVGDDLALQLFGSL